MIPFTWSAEVCGSTVHSDATLLTVTTQRRLVPDSVVHTARCCLHFDAARTEVKVQIDVPI